MKMQFDKIELKTLCLICILYTTRMFGLFMILPVFSTHSSYLTNSNNQILLGLALGAYGISQVLMQIPFEKFAQKFGSKQALLLAFFFFIIGNLLCYSTNNIHLFILGRAVSGFGAVSGVLLYVVNHSVVNEKQSVAMAFIGICIGLSFVISVPLATFLVAKIALKGLILLNVAFGCLSVFTVFLLKDIHFIKQENNKKTGKINLIYLSIFALHFVLTSFFMQSAKQIQIDNLWQFYALALLVGFSLSLYFIVRAEISKNFYLYLNGHIFILLVSFCLLLNNLYLLSLTCFFLGFCFLEAILPSLNARINKGNSLKASYFTTYQFLGASCGAILSPHFAQINITLLLILLVWLILSLKYSKNLNIEVRKCVE